MSCDAVAFTATCGWPPPAPSGAARGRLPRGRRPPSVAGEPLFVDIVRRAGHLKAEDPGLRKGAPGAATRRS